MKSIINTDIAVAYSQCPLKSYLLLFGSKNATPHEYVQILEKKRDEQRTRYFDVLAQEHRDVHTCSRRGLSGESALVTNAILNSGFLEAECDLLTRVRSHSNLGHFSYQPTIFVGTHKINREDRLTLFFTARVLEQIQKMVPAVGHIVDVVGKRHKVNLADSSRYLRDILEPLQEWVADDAPTEPPVILNNHCPLCQFRVACRAKAEKEDNLSLLDRVTPKIVRNYERKGIFTVTQLSYTFRPRRRRKRTRNPAPVTHKLELQALAIREGKIYLQELPELPRQPVELFLDIEGIPDQNAYYLIGLLVRKEESSTHHAFWADTLADEAHIWKQFINVASQYPDAPIYHYGNYDAKALTKLSKRYETDVDQLFDQLINVNKFIYGKIYFPVYSNRLKDIGQYIGATWSAPEASGLQSLVWWHSWEETTEIRYQKVLIAYNTEDCQALSRLTDTLSQMEHSTNTISAANLAGQAGRQASEIGREVHDQFELIRKFAHSDYDKKKISFRKDKVSRQTRLAEDRRKPQKGRPRVTKTINVTPRKFCPVHVDKPLCLTEKFSSRIRVDLVLMKSGIKKTVTEIRAIQGYCSACGKRYSPASLPGHSILPAYGNGFKAWVVYQRVALRMPYASIVELACEQFNEIISVSSVSNFLRYTAHDHTDTEKATIQRLLNSPFIHADETPVNIRGANQYVWVFTDGKYAVFRFTETREAAITHEFLADYKGILISDFYPGYDSVKCEQQKCWVHLIRDLNSDLWKAPLDNELETFATEVRDLIIPIMETIELYGLKKRNLGKFEKKVTKFYDQVVVNKRYRSDLAKKYQDRFMRHRHGLFTFLRHDNIPWHNNTAEQALRHLCVQEKISGSFFGSMMPDYLLLLGIRQSCRFQGKSFFKFLLSGETDLDEFQKSKRSRG